MNKLLFLFLFPVVLHAQPPSPSPTPAPQAGNPPWFHHLETYSKVHQYSEHQKNYSEQFAIGYNRVYKFPFTFLASYHLYQAEWLDTDPPSGHFHFDPAIDVPESCRGDLIVSEGPHIPCHKEKDLDRYVQVGHRLEENKNTSKRKSGPCCFHVCGSKLENTKLTVETCPKQSQR